MTLFSFLEHSPTPWHAVDFLQKSLMKKGYTALDLNKEWDLKPQGKYFVIFGGATLIAFQIPKTFKKMVLIAAHTDSPGLKLKHDPETTDEGYLLWGFDVYGSPIHNSWFNRDLALAGRIFYEEPKSGVASKLVFLKEYPFIIPDLAIHLDRDPKKKDKPFDAEVQFKAVMGYAKKEGAFKEILHKNLLSHELFAIPLDPPRRLGIEGDLYSSYRIDNLTSTYAILEAFLEKEGKEQLKMALFFDHEEIGSRTPRGAGSHFVMQILQRMAYGLKMSQEHLLGLLPQSLVVSVDVSHAIPPHHKDTVDLKHTPKLGEGVVLKMDTQQAYATDAAILAQVAHIAKKGKVPLQYYSNKAGIRTGSTIGPLLGAILGVPTIDLGVPQLSMHSVREVSSLRDYASLVKLLSLMYHGPISL